MPSRTLDPAGNRSRNAAEPGAPAFRNTTPKGGFYE